MDVFIHIQTVIVNNPQTWNFARLLLFIGASTYEAVNFRVAVRRVGRISDSVIRLPDEAAVDYAFG